LLAHPLSYLLKNHQVYLIWGFIGCIIGVLPTLWKDAGKEGRVQKHYNIFILTAVIGLCVLYALEVNLLGRLALNQSMLTWLFMGALLCVLMIVPGVSTSNILIYMGMYEPLIEGLRTIDFSVLMPIFIGIMLCLFPLSRLINYLLKTAYATSFHIIFGIVIASTIMIIPRNYNYFSWRSLLCLSIMMVGVIFGLWISRLEQRYKSEKTI
jgi:putative membrane protein